MDTNAVTAVPIHEARMVLNLFPWGVLTAAVAFMCSLVIQRVAGGMVLRPLRHAGQVHWTEKARLAYPVWKTLAMGQICQPFLWFIVSSAFRDQYGLGMVTLVTLAAFLGAGVASTHLESKVRERPVTIREWAQGWAVQWLLFLAMIAVYLFMAWALPEQLDWTAVGIILAAMGVVAAMSFGGSLIFARWLGLLRPPTRQLQAVVDLAVQRMGVKPPAVYVLRWKVSNALAFPFSHAIAVTDTALNSLSDDQLAAICSHELAHLNEPRNIHLARLAGQFVWLPLFLLSPLQAKLGFQEAFLLVFGAVMIGLVLVRRMVLAMEKRADSAGQAHEGEAGTYAKALEKIYEVNLIPAVVKSRMPTHPQLYDRLLAAGIQPDYPRPQPPSLARARAAMALVLIGTLFCMFVWMGWVQAVQAR